LAGVEEAEAAPQEPDGRMWIRPKRLVLVEYEEEREPVAIRAHGRYSQNRRPLTVSAGTCYSGVGCAFYAYRAIYGARWTQPYNHHSIKQRAVMRSAISTLEGCALLILFYQLFFPFFTA
jgi:hypothetical protein